MVVRWSEEQLAQHHQRTAHQKRETRKVAATPPPPPRPGVHVGRLAFLIPTPNGWQRMHFRARRRMMQTIADALVCEFPKLIGKALDKPAVHIVRCSSVRPDPDAERFCKPILDAMQVAGKRHPYGVGILVDDSHDHIVLTAGWEPAPPKQGYMRIEVTP